MVVLLSRISSHTYDGSGIWECLSSQDTINFIRRKVYEGKELPEIGELICDHFLAPFEHAEESIGCDNMTIVIVALLHGRTKEEWYSWIHYRVETNYGYETPSEPRRVCHLMGMAGFYGNP